MSQVFSLDINEECLRIIWLLGIYLAPEIQNLKKVLNVHVTAVLLSRVDC